MASSINTVFMVGYVGKDPIEKSVGEFKLCSFSLGTTHVSKKRDGSLNKEVCFIECVVWGKDAQACLANLHKGSKVAIEGRLKLNTWEDKETKKPRSNHTIQVSSISFISDLNNGSQVEDVDQQEVSQPQRKAAVQSAPKTQSYSQNIFDDLPF